MQLWRIHIKTEAQKGKIPFNFCLQERIVGIGWGVSRKPTSKADYCQLVEAEYPIHFGHRWKKKHKSWKAASNAIIDRLKDGDLIWARSTGADYFLGKIRGDWQYDDSADHAEADLYNFRDCKWVKVGVMDNVPGSVINRFNRSATVQKVRDEDALVYSQYLFAKLTKESFEPPKEKRCVDLLQLLSAEDLEDVVALYLQFTKGYKVFPTTAKLSTKAVECILVSPETGQRIGMQVKSGKESVNQDAFSAFQGIVYLFSACNSYLGQTHAHVKCLPPDDIRRFTFDNKSVMPARVQHWIEFAEQFR